jgi:hypothetical protein
MWLADDGDSLRQPRCRAPPSCAQFIPAAAVVAPTDEGKAMDEFVNRLSRFRGQALKHQKALFERWTTEDQSPRALMISCADSRALNGRTGEFELVDDEEAPVAVAPTPRLVDSNSHRMAAE